MVGALGRVLGGPRAAAAARDDSDEHRSGYWECAGTVLFLDLCQRAHLLLWAAGGAVALGSQAPDRVPVAAALGLTALGLLAAFFGDGSAAPDSGRRAGDCSVPSAAPLRSAISRFWRSRRRSSSPPPSGTTSPSGRSTSRYRRSPCWPHCPSSSWRRAADRRGARGNEPGRLALPARGRRRRRAGQAALLAYSLSAHLTFLLANAALGAPFLPAAWRAIRAPERGPSLGSPWMSLNNPWIK